MLRRSVFSYKDFSEEFHKYIVISSADKNGDVLCVNFTSYDDKKDKTCVVLKTEYSGLKDKSCIEYNRVLVINQNHLMKCIVDATYKTHIEVSPGLLQRIQDGAKSSPRFKKLKYGYFFSLF
jgi:hypothetical protein